VTSFDTYSHAAMLHKLSRRSRKTALRLLACFAIVVAAASPARAQIYTWHDATGHLVLSDRALGAVEHTYSVPGAESVRATRPVPGRRGQEYDNLILEHAQRNSVRTDLVRAVVQVESAFNPWARSPKGALGLMQLMPATIQQFNVRNAFNPEENVRAGVRYLRQLLDRYDNNERLALAAYNAGPGAVDRHGQAVPPYRETRDYVSKISGLAASAAAPREPERRIYRVVEVVDGREVMKFTDRKPSGGIYEEVVGR
jgi:soluble lytic murein transglycosylase-like protein